MIVKPCMWTVLCTLNVIFHIMHYYALEIHNVVGRLIVCLYIYIYTSSIYPALPGQCQHEKL